MTTRRAALMALLVVSLIATSRAQTSPKAITPDDQVSSPEIKAQHQKLYANSHSGTDLTQASKDVSIMITATPIQTRDKAEEKKLPSYPDVELLHVACGADAVVSGSFTKQETTLNESKDFMFTDSVFHVDSVLKKAGIADGSDIVVTRPGGETTVNGHTISVEIDRLPMFQLNRRYLLFLHYLPASKTYSVLPSGIFLLGADRFSPVQRTDVSARKIQSNSTLHENEFFMEVRAAVTSACPGPLAGLN